MYNTLITSVLGKNPKLVPPAALSELEVIFELFTQPSILKVTIVVDMQDEEKHLASECKWWEGEKGGRERERNP